MLRLAAILNTFPEYNRILPANSSGSKLKGPARQVSLLEVRSFVPPASEDSR
jgi:hypothetical protein